MGEGSQFPNLNHNLNHNLLLLPKSKGNGGIKIRITITIKNGEASSRLIFFSSTAVR